MPKRKRGRGGRRKLKPLAHTNGSKAKEGAESAAETDYETGLETEMETEYETEMEKGNDTETNDYLTPSSPQPSTSAAALSRLNSTLAQDRTSVVPIDITNLTPMQTARLVQRLTYQQFMEFIQNNSSGGPTKLKADKLKCLRIHPLLKDNPSAEEIPKGTLVYAKSEGSVFWPACVLPPFREQDKDITNKQKKRTAEIESDGDSDESAPTDDATLDNLKSVCLFYIEENFRIDCVTRSKIIPFKLAHKEEQYSFVTELNKTEKKWTPSPKYKKSYEMMLDFVAIESKSRLTHARQIGAAIKEERRKKFAVIKEKRVTKSVASGTKIQDPTPGPSHASIPQLQGSSQTLRFPDEFQLEDSVFDTSCLPLLKNDMSRGLRSKTCHESESDPSFIEEIDLTGDFETNKPKKANKSMWAHRPKSGEELKAWVKNMFDSKDKKFNFPSSSLRCTRCKNVVQGDDLINCHDYPYHKSCVITTKVSVDGVEKTTYKCEDCTHGRCFVCKTSDGSNTIVKCRLCDLKFHRDCLKKWPQGEIIGSQGSVTCPLHFCHTCKLEHRIKNQVRDYKISKQQSHRCLYCMTAYHKGCCLPAGVGSTIMGNQFIVCLKHTGTECQPKQQKKGRGLGCFTCDKKLNKNGDVLECTICPIMYHASCGGYSKDDKAAGITFDQYKENFRCEGCRWGSVPLYGQVVLYRQPGSVFWPAMIGFPKAFASRNVTKPGTVTVMYCGTKEQYFDSAEAMGLFQTFAISHLDLLQKFKIYNTKDAVVTAFEEAKYLAEIAEAYRNSLLPKAEPIYKKIDHNIYKNIPRESMKKCTKSHDIEACICGVGKGEHVCVDEDSCHNREMLFECNDKNCTAGSRCKNRMFTEKRDSIEKYLEYFNSEKGWGVRTKSAIENGQFILEYVGEVLTKQEAAFRTARKLEDDPLYLMELNANNMIDAEYYGNLSRLINHSCDPNCLVQVWTSGLGKLVAGIFAQRDIPAGEELTFNYKYNRIGTCMSCYCGSAKCKKYIGDGSRLTERLVMEGQLDPKNLEKDLVDWDEVCFVCQLGGKLLMCEAGKCRRAYHIGCVGLKKIPPPSVKWVCPDHKSTTSVTKKSKTAKRKTSMRRASTDSKPSTAKKSKVILPKAVVIPESSSMANTSNLEVGVAEKAKKKQARAPKTDEERKHDAKIYKPRFGCRRDPIPQVLPPKTLGKTRAKSRECAEKLEAEQPVEEGIPKIPLKRVTRMSACSFQENKDPNNDSPPKAPESPRRNPPSPMRRL